MGSLPSNNDLKDLLKAAGDDVIIPYREKASINFEASVCFSLINQPF
jgi:hypothetical protein